MSPARVHTSIVRVLREEQPGPTWQAIWRDYGAAYLRWFLREGERARPTFLTCDKAIHRHMPEIYSLYHELVELAGGSDRAARLLSLYRPTPFLTGCSQVVWTGNEPALIRNYDFSPRFWEGTFLSTRWISQRVLGAGDCLWGLLDGMNEAGLAVALSFGGRRVVGDGFGVPLIVRYLLETCTTLRQACSTLHRLPINMAYNLTMLDREGNYVTAYLSPEREPIMRRWPITTNHQATNDWPEYVERAGSVEREKFLAARLGDPQESLGGLINEFLRPPLFQTNFSGSYGTLYTSVYRPQKGIMEVLWPERSVQLSLRHTHPQEFLVHFRDSATGWNAPPPALETYDI